MNIHPHQDGLFSINVVVTVFMFCVVLISYHKNPMVDADLMKVTTPTQKAMSWLLNCSRSILLHRQPWQLMWETFKQLHDMLVQSWIFCFLRFPHTYPFHPFFLWDRRWALPKLPTSKFSYMIWKTRKRKKTEKTQVKLQCFCMDYLILTFDRQRLVFLVL